jgi:ribulose-5-phosphate 4-epimerase/fuculose-1-phosphate aldolase
MFCEEKDCTIEDCGRDCKRKREACGVPIVSGELGAGGIARTVPPAIIGTGACIVYGHGVFTTGKQGFDEAFGKMVEVENRCREEYFRLIERRHGL